MAAPLLLRRALVILDMQNEFLDPSGRCKVINHATAQKNPPFVENILRFATAFRQTGNGDVIWVRSEFDKPRDANEEKILLYEEEDDDNDDDDGDRIGRFDEFLSLDTDPFCAKGTSAVEFHNSVAVATKTPGDRVLQKTWYSAFKNTGLVEILRGRLATELFICGLKTNVSVFATASDAVRHGFQVTVLSDCVGYSDQKLHDVALGKITGVLGCEVIRSAIMVKSWAAKNKPARSKSATKPATTSKEDLAKMIEKLTLGTVGGYDDAEPSELEPAQSQLKDVGSSKGMKGNAAKQLSRLEQDSVLPPGHKTVLERAQAHVDATQNSDKSDKTSSDIPRGAIVEVAERPVRKMRNVPTVLKEGDLMGEGDTRLVNGILPPDLCDVAFERLKREVRWRTMSHRGGEVPRLVAVEGDVGEDGR